jgi:hypothetical protein
MLLVRRPGGGGASHLSGGAAGGGGRGGGGGGGGIRALVRRGFPDRLGTLLAVPRGHHPSHRCRHLPSNSRGRGGSGGRRRRGRRGRPPAASPSCCSTVGRIAASALRLHRLRTLQVGPRPGEGGGGGVSSWLWLAPLSTAVLQPLRLPPQAIVLLATAARRRRCRAVPARAARAVVRRQRQLLLRARPGRARAAPPMQGGSVAIAVLRFERIKPSLQARHGESNVPLLLLLHSATSSGDQKSLLQSQSRAHPLFDWRSGQNPTDRRGLRPLSRRPRRWHLH